MCKLFGEFICCLYGVTFGLHRPLFVVYTLPRQVVWSTSNQSLKFRILRLGMIAQSGTKSGLWGPKIMKPPRARTRMQKKSRKSVLCFWKWVNILPMGIAVGSDVFRTISPTFGLSGLFLHFQPWAHFSREYVGEKVQASKSKNSGKIDHFESCGRLIRQ